MSDLPEIDTTESLVAERGSYKLLKKRLADHDQGAGLQWKTQALNAVRFAEFGRTAQTTTCPRRPSTTRSKRA
jgi:hypothetical protein